MSQESTRKIISRAVTDETFRRELFTDPDPIFAQYDLTDEERNALRSIPAETMDDFANQLEKRISMSLIMFGAEASGAHSAGAQATGAHSSGASAAGAHADGAGSFGAQASGMQAAGSSAYGANATGVTADGAQSLGASAAGVNAQGALAAGAQA